MASTQFRFARLGLLLLALLAPAAPAQEPAADDVKAVKEHLDEARKQFLRGRYDEAAELFRKRPADPEAVIGLARCLTATGKQPDAHRLLMKAVAQDEKPASLHAELALIAMDAGEWKLAEEEAQAALKLAPDSLPAHWVIAESLRTRGKLAEAEREYAWFIDRQRQLVAARKSLDAESSLWIGLAAAQHARWTRNHRLFHSLVNDLYPSALEADEDFWPAHLQIALLFFEKYNEPEALAALAAGLAINPQAADLHAARAAIAVRSFDMVTANSSIERAQAINPRHVWAGQLAADVHMIHTAPAKAVEQLEKTLEFRPRDEQTLGRLLGCYAVLDGRSVADPSERMRSRIEEATARNPHAGELFLAAGDALDRMRRYEQAADFYREAHRRLPQLSTARSQLGMTLMRLGAEKEAAEILEEAFQVDPFHVRVKNTLEVLDLLQGYAVLETEHFVLKFDRGQDELLARYAARHLEEEVYPRVVKTLGYEPPEKTLFEIFSRAKNTSGHGWFSARMVGLPAIGTVGACAGKMVAITTPRELPKKYNWAKVLGHEFVHVVNLQQTGFNVPHWLTEGIAVHLEDQPRPDAWTALLVRRHEAGSLFNLDNILFGFVRPQQKDDWTLAYCQAELYVEYMREKHGADAIQRLLAAYGDRLPKEEAISRAFGVSQSEFEQGYGEFLNGVVQRHKNSADAPAPELAKALERAQEMPQDAAAAANAALAYLARDDKPQARTWARKAVALDNRHPAANYVLARLQLSIGDTEQATQFLTDALDVDEPHAASLVLLAAIKVQQEDYAEAARLYELGKRTFPESDRWAKGLATVYLKQGENDKLQPILVELAANDPDNATMRRKLAQLALEGKDFEAARRWAQELVHLDVEDPDAHELLGKALQGLMLDQKAAEEFAVAKQLKRNN